MGGMFGVFSVQPDPAKCGNDSAMVLCSAASLTQISCRLRQWTRTESEQACVLMTWFKPFNGELHHKQTFERHCLKEICIQLTEACEHPGALESTIAVISVQ